MPSEPADRLISDLLKGSRFFEQMSGPWNNEQFLWTGELFEGFPVHLDHWSVISSHQ